MTSTLQAFTRGTDLARTGVLSAPASNARVLEQLRALHPVTRDALDRVRRCATCALPYRERDNIGRWECYFHMGVFDRDGTERWACCGRRLRECGCRRCDHSETPHSLARVALELPEWADGWVLQPVPADAIANSMVTDAWVIWDIRAPEDRAADPDEEKRYRNWVSRRRRLIARGDYMIRWEEMK